MAVKKVCVCVCVYVQTLANEGRECMSSNPVNRKLIFLFCDRLKHNKGHEENEAGGDGWSLR